MSRNWIHKMIATWCFIITMLPMSVQFAHALESHEHDICELQNTQHFHKNQIDCEFNHFLFKSNATFIATETDLRETNNNASSTQFLSDNLLGIESISTSSRAPPHNIF